MIGLSVGNYKPKSITPPGQSAKWWENDTWIMVERTVATWWPLLIPLALTTKNNGTMKPESWDHRGSPALSHSVTHNSMPFCLKWWVQCSDTDECVQKTFAVIADTSNYQFSMAILKAGEVYRRLIWYFGLHYVLINTHFFVEIYIMLCHGPMSMDLQLTML